MPDVRLGVEVLGGPAVAAGFSLAGFAAEELSTPAEATQRLRVRLADPRCGVILLEEDLYAALPEEMRRWTARRALPMLVPFPGPAWAEAPTAAESYIVELLRQAIGYRVKLR